MISFITCQNRNARRGSFLSTTAIQSPPRAHEIFPLDARYFGSLVREYIASPSLKTLAAAARLLLNPSPRSPRLHSPPRRLVQSRPCQVQSSSMAAFNKLGSLLRQSALTSSASTGSAPALFNAARFMSCKLFVGGLSWGTDDQSLKEAFTSFGDVVEARVITDRDTGKSRGFGFVSFADEEAAKTAASSMDGQELQGRSVRVNFANERPAGGSFGGGGGGGFGGGRGGGGGGYGGGDRGYGGDRGESY